MFQGINISNAVLEEMHPESCFEKVFASVADAVFCGYSANINIRCVEKFKNFGQWLFCVVDSLKAGILFGISVASFVKGKFFADIWDEILMYFSAPGPSHAVRRPYSSLILE